jgi:gliding motility-associated-like protein
VRHPYLLLNLLFSRRIAALNTAPIFSILLIFFLATNTFAQVPVITSVSPNSGPVGTTVTITGSGFNAIATSNIVYFGAVRAAVTSATTTSLNVTVPLGSTHQTIAVISNNLISYSKIPFITTFPCGGNISNNSFAPKIDFQLPGGNPYGTAIKDIDNDGKPDLVMVNGAQLTVYKNTGFSSNISFSAALSAAITSYPVGVATDDLDGDGKADIVVTDFNASKISVFRNTSTPGNISFAPKIDYTTGASPYGVAIGDLDLDGRPEIVVSNHYSSPSTISVFKNTSTINNISFANKADFATGNGPRGIAIGDIDDNGKPDIVIANQGSSSISIIRNLSSSGSLSFAPKRDYGPLAVDAFPESVTVADFNGDGKLEIAVAQNNTGWGEISIFFNASSAGTMSLLGPGSYSIQTSPFSIAAADLNGDGKPDIAVTNQVDNSVSILENTTTATSTLASFGIKKDFSTGLYPRSISIGDLDGDEKPDLFVANNNGGSFSILRNLGAASTPSISISTASTSICAGTSTTFAASATNAGGSPVFQWKVNGINVGTNSATYTSSTLSNNDVVSCELTVNTPCLSNATVISNSIKITVNPLPVVTISGDTCVGGVLTVNSNVPPDTLLWKVNNTTTVSTQKAGINPNAVTVAGGNGYGSNANQLNAPNRLYIDAAGNMYIPDMANARIQKWTVGATSGVTVAGGKGVGYAANQFDRPTSVAVDSKGNIYVTDQNNSRIQRWAPGATSGQTFAYGLASPTAIFIDANDNIYVSQQNASLVTKFPAGSTTGVTVAGGNGYGSAPNQLSAPTGIFVDAAGNVYICDTDNSRVQKWSPGATSGVTVAGGKGDGSAANQLYNPLGIFVDNYGNIYISDYNNARVQKWAPGATSGTTVAGGNGLGTAPNQLNRPAGIWVDANGDLYVSDFNNYRVQKFSNSVAKTYTTLTAGNYTATVTSVAGCSATSNIVTVIPLKTPQVSITSNLNIICQGVPVTFTASATYGGNNTLYQWKVNGVNTGGNSNNNSFVTTSLKKGDAISCVITSNADLCLTLKAATSNIITINNAPTEAAAISIIASDTSVCTGSVITFTAKPVNGGTTPAYKWKINNVDVPNGSNATYSSSALKDGDVISCSMISNANLCPSNLTAASNAITIHIIPLKVSTITINADDTSICTGTSVSFRSSVSNEGTNPVYDWKINGQSVGTNKSVFITNQLRDGDMLSCSLTSNVACLQNQTISSNYIKIRVDEVPVTRMRPDTVIFLGSSIRLNTIITNRVDTFRWSPAATLDNYTIVSPLATPIATTTYKLIATTIGGCKAAGQVTISTITQVVVSNAFSPNGDGINDTWNIPGLSAYSDCKVEVYNRYGQLVFASRGYTNRWDGTSNGKPLPVGTYYYIININSLNDTRKGAITILR